MEIWVEYFMRHNMPLLCPYPPFLEEGGINIIVRPNPPYEYRRWAEFVSENRASLSESQAGRQVLVWGSEIAESRLNIIPALREQQSVVFAQLPELGRAWDVFNNLPYRERLIRWSCSNTVRDFHRLLTVQDQSYPER